MAQPLHRFRHRVLHQLDDAQKNFEELESQLSPGLLTVVNASDFGGTDDPRKWRIAKVRPGCWWVIPPYLIENRTNRPPVRSGGEFKTGAEAMAAFRAPS